MKNNISFALIIINRNNSSKELLVKMNDGTYHIQNWKFNKMKYSFPVKASNDTDAIKCMNDHILTEDTYVE